MRDKLIQIYYNDKQNTIFETYFEWCYRGNSSNTWYYVYKGDKAYYDCDSDQVFLNKDDYFEQVISRDEQFFDYIKRYYPITFK